MSDPTNNPPDESSRPPSETPPPPPPPGAQGSYGTGATPPPPPPPGGWQQQQPGAGWQQPMPPPTGQQPTGGVGQPADLMPRFLARLIDYVLLMVVNLIIGVLVVGAMLGLDAGSPAGGAFTMSSTETWAANAVTTLISTAITLGYFALMESSQGQTVGKMLLKLETRGPGGGRPTMAEALKRNAFVAIGLLGLVPVLGFVGGLLSLAAVIMIAVTINQDTVQRHGWHDNFAGGTTVYKIG